MSLEQIVSALAKYRTRYVTVTGGEPLAQRPCQELLGLLCGEGYRVSLETSGAMDIEPVDSRVINVMDLKKPGSGQESRNRYENIEHLKPKDQIILREEMAKVYDKLDQLNREDNAKARQALINQGIEFIEPDPSELQNWRELSQQAVKRMIDKGIVDRHFVELVDNYLKQYRNQ